MENQPFKKDISYRVYFEKAIPIVFKFLKVDEQGRILCENEKGEPFDFNALPQYLSIKEL